VTVAQEKTPPVKLPNEPAITPQIVAEHGLAPDEYQRLLKIMGRDPTMVELGIFSAMWSEHCSYKSSKVWLKKLPTKAPWVIQGPGENAGVIDIGDGQAAIFKMEAFQISIVNNILWLLIVPAVTVALGVIVAVLSDKLSAQSEKISKSMMFLPMAISFVGASAIWGLVYAYDSPGEIQTGLLNWIWTMLGGDPVTWLQVSTARLNSLLMMVILIWLQVGFAMILLSSAIKGVPEDTIEAARIDGATELQIFWQVIIPQVKGTIITVFITVLIMVLKVFDIVYVLTNGNFKSNVIANLFFNKLFADGQAGQASAIVVILLIAVLPALYWQVRHFREEEANR